MFWCFTMVYTDTTMNKALTIEKFSNGSINLEEAVTKLQVSERTIYRYKATYLNEWPPCIISITYPIYSNLFIFFSFSSTTTFSKNIALGLTHNAFSPKSSLVYSARYTTNSSSVSLWFAIHITSYSFHL